MKILQANLHRSHIAQRTAAIRIPAAGDIRCRGDGRGCCYVYVKLREFTILSCYLTPNDTIEAIQHKIDDIEEMLGNSMKAL